MIWRVYFLRTMTGERGPLLQQSDNSPWKQTLNGTDEVTVTLSKEDLLEMNRDWWTPLKAGLLVTLEIDEGEKPFVAGIFFAPPEETLTEVTFAAEGINTMLSRRVVLDDDYFSTGSSLARVSDLAKSKLSRKGYSLGTIMQEIVKASVDKLGGQLPVDFGSPREIATGLNERNYKGWNLANNDALKLIEALSNVINGPDFMFRPEWSDEDSGFHNHVVWTLYHGTANQPTIYQTWTMDLDTTSPRTGVTDVKVKANLDDYANRAYWTGAGEDAGTLIRGYQDTRQLSKGIPLIEYVGSTSDSENASLVQEKAKSYVQNNKYPLNQVSVTLDASDERYRLDRWHVGDSARVTVKGWINIPDGTHNLRIIAASGSVGSDIVAIEFAEETNDGQEV